MGTWQLFKLLAQLRPAGRGVGQRALTIWQVYLQRGFGHIDANIGFRRIGFHCVLTHPYEYELPVKADAQATVRVWSTGRRPLPLGYGIAKGQPRVERARRRHRCPLRKDSSLSFLPKQESRNKTKCGNRCQSHCLPAPRVKFIVARLRDFTPSRSARLRKITQPGKPLESKFEHNAVNQMNQTEHIRVATEATLGSFPPRSPQP
jgi:hypothetical protein